MIKFWKLKFKQEVFNACLVRRFGKLRNSPPIYHIHIRKSAGTSVNASFWKIADIDFKTAGKSVLINNNGFVAIRHHKELIEKGCYHFANSHTPFWKLQLPKNVHTFTVFRDPMKRLISLYKYYYWHANEPQWAKSDPQHNNVLNYTHWLGNSFQDFLELTPRMHIENQLYMFSENFDVDEALDNVSKVSFIYSISQLNKLENDIKENFNFNIKIGRERSYNYELPFSLTTDDRNKAKIYLKNEYEFYTKLNKLYNLEE